MLDIEKIRADFPILKREVYDHPLVYFDNAATTQKPQIVLDRIMQSYTNENANIHRGVHHLSALATKAHEDARTRVAQFIGANSSDEIIFTRGTTESINLVARTWVEDFCSEGDEIVITQMEHHSNIVPWQMVAQRKGLKLQVAPINEDGELILPELEKLLNAHTRLVAIAHVSNVLGTINPIAEIAEMVHRHGALLLVDGAQAIAHQKVDVKALGADFYAFSGHKVYAPNGIGVLWGKREILEKMSPFQGGGEMIEKVTFEHTTYNALPYKFEAGTPDYVGSVALATAFDYLDSIGHENIMAYEQKLLHYATEQLETIEGVRIVGRAKEKDAVISFNVDDIHPYDIGMMLDKLGIAVRTGHHCAEPLMDHYGIPGAVRASFAFYNTKAEIDYFITSLKRVLNILR